jgi:hypothetical protein
MTMPDERLRAVIAMREAVRELIPHYVGCRQRKGKMARVPIEKLSRVVSLLKHYPGEYDMERTAEKVPHIFGKP